MAEVMRYTIDNTEDTIIALPTDWRMENKNNELKNTWVGCIFLVHKAIGVSLLVTV